MLGRLRADLETELRSRGVPVRVEYGPVAPARALELRDAIVVQHDPTGDDVVGKRTASARFVRVVRAIVRVHAASTVSGARRQDHEDRAHLLVDQVLVALDEVLRGDGRYVWRCAGGAFDDADAARVAASATYELRIEIERSVVDVPWDQSAAPGFTLGAGSIASRTNVHGSTGEGAGETSCGGD